MEIVTLFYINNSYLHIELINKTNMKTNKIKKVLIALDYNPTAQKVAETGSSLA